MGFVKISDDLTNWAWISDPKTVYIYVRLLLGAAWTETDYRNVHLKRGQIAISQRDFAEKCGVTYQELRTILNRLISTHKITQSTTHKFSIITLNDYDCNTQSLTQSSTENQRDSNAITTRCQRNSNAPTLLYTDDKIIREQKSREALPEFFEKVRQTYNTICVSLPPLEYDLTIQQSHLITQAQTNLRDVSFEEYFRRVEKSDFLTGRTGGSFKANFDWLLKPANINKVLSGNYDCAYTDTTQERPKDYSGSLWD